MHRKRVREAKTKEFLNALRRKLIPIAGSNNTVLRGKNMAKALNVGTSRDPEVNKKEGNKISNYIIVGCLIFFSLSLIRNISNVRRVEKRIETKAQEVEKLKREQEKLELQLEYAKSQEFIEKQLRDKLGLAKQDEIVVVLPPPEVVRKFAPHYEEGEEVVLPDPNWKKWMKLFI